MTVSQKQKRPYRVHNRLKGELIARGYSQAEVSRRIGITPEHLNAVLNGHAPLPPRLARDIAFATGIPLNVIVPQEAEGHGN